MSQTSIRTLGASALLYASCSLATAATLDVCPSGCTYTGIQDAIDAASAGDVIDIAAGTYAGDVDISVADLTIRGAGAGSTIVEGLGFAAFIFRAAAGSAIVRDVSLSSPHQVSCLYNYGARVQIEDAVIEECGATQTIGSAFVGGAIYTTGDLELRRVTLRDNTANVSSIFDGLGGAIYIVGDAASMGPTVRILDSELSGNTASHGGAVYAEPDTRVFVDGSTLRDNAADILGPSDGHGGAMWSSGALTVTSSRFEDNYADSNGAAIALVASSDGASIAASQFVDNVTFMGGAVIPRNAGGAIYIESSGEVVISGSEFSGNVASNGGAIGTYNLLTGGAVTVKTSTFSENAAGLGGGGAIYAAGGAPVSLSSITASDNTTEYFGVGGPGGALTGVLGATFVVQGSTIAGNTADGTGGGLGAGGGSFELYNSIVAGNTALTSTAAGTTNDCDGSVTSNNFNLIGTGDGCSIVAASNDDIGTDVAPVDPLLAALTDNGGLTLTRALLPGSPAIGGGPLFCQSLDQRGYARSGGVFGFGFCDQGALESNAVCGAPKQARTPEPANGAVAVEHAPLLTWEPAVHAESYDVILATQPPPFAGGIVAIESGLTASHWTPPVTLDPATTYYWRVKSHNTCGNRALSVVWSFTTQ